MGVPCYPVSVKALIERKGKYFFLVKKRGDKVFYGLPGDLKEPGESLEEALVREVKEETGLIVEPLKLLGATTYIHHTGTENVVLLYLAKLVGGEIHLHGEPDVEFLGYEWLTEEEIGKKIEPPKYRDFILNLLDFP